MSKGRAEAFAGATPPATARYVDALTPRPCSCRPSWRLLTCHRWPSNSSRRPAVIDSAGLLPASSIVLILSGAQYVRSIDRSLLFLLVLSVPNNRRYGRAGRTPPRPGRISVMQNFQKAAAAGQVVHPPSGAPAADAAVPFPRAPPIFWAGTETEGSGSSGAARPAFKPAATYRFIRHRRRRAIFFGSPPRLP